MLILLSAKSFVGKDTICQQIIKDHAEFKRVSVADTMKIEYMKEHPDVDLFNREQKEKHRLDLKKFTHQFPLRYWIEKTPYCDNCICTDIRTTEEIEYIQSKFPNSVVLTVRIEASDEVRSSRGWVFQSGYDDSYLETQLDDYCFDLGVVNETQEDLVKCASHIYECGIKNHFIDIGNGFRITSTPFNGIPFLNTADIFKCWEYRHEYTYRLALSIVKSKRIPTYILAIESGGYPLGMLLAEALRIPFVIARKPGKLPPPVKCVNYSMEYREKNEMEIQADAFPPGSKVLIVDDAIVTGGTLLGAAKLVESLGAVVTGFACLAIMKTEKEKVIDLSQVYVLFNIDGLNVTPCLPELNQFKSPQNAKTLERIILLFVVTALAWFYLLI
jgi:adenine phosphoribosyltransferase/phosphomevalonate kinase